MKLKIQKKFQKTKKIIQEIKQNLQKIYKKIKFFLSRIFFRNKFSTVFFILIFILCFLYGTLFFFAKRIETIVSFPGVFVNTLETTHPEIVHSDIGNSEKIIVNDTTQGIFINNNSEKTVYYFHGNGGDLSYFSGDIQYISNLGYNVLALEYPGYGEVDGFPFREEVLDAASKLYEYAKDTYSITDENTIVWGYSIGTGIATEFAQNKDIDALLLFASYTSRYDLARNQYGFPVQKLFFLPDSFITSENIKNVSAAKLLVHGTKDSLIPFAYGEENFNNALGDKFFVTVEGGDHYDFLQRENVREDIVNFLEYKTLDKNLIEEIQKKLFLENIDMSSDESIYKYIDSKIPFTQKSYIPQDMRKLSREYISDTKGDAQMREVAAEQFEAMAKSFYEAFGEKIVVVSSYRSYSYQAGIKAAGCPDNLCAKAGYSEHQSGLAIDLWSASSDAYWKSSSALMKKYAWLDENAYKFGFSNSYKNGVKIDGYEIEPWHWRYVGPELSEYLHANNQTFAEFYYESKTK